MVETKNRMMGRAGKKQELTWAYVRLLLLGLACGFLQSKIRRRSTVSWKN
jgi:hypothetical protein